MAQVYCGDDDEKVSYGDDDEEVATGRGILRLAAALRPTTRTSWHNTSLDWGRAGWGHQST